MNLNEENENHFDFKSSINGFEVNALVNREANKMLLKIGESAVNLTGLQIPFLIESLNTLLLSLGEKGTDISIVYSSEESRQQLLDSCTFDFKELTKENLFEDSTSKKYEDAVETFVEEDHPFKSPEDIQIKSESIVDSLLSVEVPEEFKNIEFSNLEKEEVLSENKENSTLGMIQETIELSYKDSPEKSNGTTSAQVSEETLYEDELKEKELNESEIIDLTSEEGMDKAIKIAEEEKMVDSLDEINSEQTFDDIVIEMKNYASLHKREFEDLSKLQISGELAVQNKHLKEIQAHLNENESLLDGIVTDLGAGNMSNINEDSSRWGENAEKIVLIHREYFRIAQKEAQKVLVQGVFDSFNAFVGVSNNIELMQNYSKFLAEAIEPKEEITEEGIPLPKQKEYSSNPKHGEIPVTGEKEDSTIFNDAATLTQEEQEEQNNFVSRMEDLENMLTGDFEVGVEEIPTFEKIQQIAKDNGELAAKEYVASLTQEQRDQLSRDRLAQLKAQKEATAISGIASSEETKENPEEKEAANVAE